MVRTALLVGSFSGFAAVGLGAFAAHGLKGFLQQTGHTQIFETAVRFQFYHTLALLLTGVLLHLEFHPMIKYTAICFIIGMVFFSGSLYAMALTGWVIFGPLTPIGGILLIIGWAILFVGIYRTKKVS
jgi:uncharacterized membrane protein YgdD (TMEM256/DUF423 family)